jgi:hypothetical protein
MPCNLWTVYRVGYLPFVYWHIGGWIMLALGTAAVIGLGRWMRRFPEQQLRRVAWGVVYALILAAWALLWTHPTATDAALNAFHTWRADAEYLQQQGKP